MTGEVPIKWGAHLDSTVFQCSKCAYTSLKKVHVEAHVLGKCQGATVLSSKCVLPVLAVGQKVAVDEKTGSVAQAATTATTATGTTASANAITGDHSTINNNTITVHVHPNLIYVGSAEERQALEAIFRDPEALQSLSHLPPAEIPAALLRLWKGADADPRLHNLEVSATRVAEHRGAGTRVSVPRAKFVKGLVNDMLQTAARVAPENTPAPEAVEELKRELTAPDLAMPKKRKISRAEAASMRVTGGREWHGLKEEGQTFLRTSDAMVDRELDAYAADRADQSRK